MESIIIELNDLRFFGRHGLYKEEQKLGGEFQIDVAISYHAPENIIHSIDQTINYATVHELVKKEMNQPKALLETFVMQVSAVLKNAYQIKECLQALNDILSYESDMLSEAQQNPLALAFALKIQNEMASKATAYYANISAVVLKANTKDLLMDAGERSTLLYKIQLDLNTLRAMAAYSYYKVHLAVMQGIINSFNPFKGYVDIDGKIVKDLLANWKH